MHGPTFPIIVAFVKTWSSALKRLALSRMGTRSVVATALQEKAEEVEQAVRLLCDSAAAGDSKSVKAHARARP